MGQDRSNIWNQGFNELVARRHADGVCKYRPTAALVSALPTKLCLHVFVALYYRSLKPAVRRTASTLHMARSILGELYSEIASGPARAPT
jgi:hypothetical protein